MKDSQKLREAAGKLRVKALVLGDEVNQVKRDYPYQRHWKGPAADTFNDTLETAAKDLSRLSDDLEEYARRLESKAAELEAEEKKAAAEKARR